MKHHRFLLLDDQGPGAELQGWLRTARVLHQYGFLRREPEKAEAGWLRDDVLVRVLSADWDGSGTGDTFDTAVQLFENERESAEDGDFDAFFCDINLSTNNSLLDTSMMDPGRQVENEGGMLEFLNKSEMARLYQSDLAAAPPDRSRFGAGLDLLELLSMNDPRPKIVYSASDATVQLRKFLQRLREDIRIVDILDRELHMPAAIDKVDHYLRLRQRLVVRKLSVEQIRTLLRRVEEGTEWDVDDLPDGWSLRTLFPRELNSGHRRALRDFIALDFRHVFPFFAGHPESQPDKRELELERLRALEFSCLDKAIVYEPSTAPEPLRHLAELSDGNRARQNEWRACARLYGVYPGDVGYIHSILELNQKHGGAMTRPRLPSVEVIEQRRPLELCWGFETAADEDKIGAMIEKFRAAGRKIARQSLSDQGMTDLAVIVCGRYKGTLRYEGGRVVITVRLSGGMLDVHRSDGASDLPPRICATITAPDEWA